jgi:hypothetical protein
MPCKNPTNSAEMKLLEFQNCILDDDAWAQASLPVSRGGLGIRSAIDLSIPAFLASVFYTSRIVSSMLSSIRSNTYKDREEAFVEWSSITSSTQPPLSNQQRDWETPILDNLSSSLIQNATTPPTKPRILSVSKKSPGPGCVHFRVHPLASFWMTPPYELLLVSG